MPSTRAPAAPSAADLASSQAALFGGRRPRIMAVLNVTPDSFYAGSRASTLGAAVERARRFAAEGADFIDVGGESTRPGAEPVPQAEELRRVVEVVERVARLGVRVSVDTSKAEVALRALEAGASVLNDVTALRGDPAMPAVARGFPAVILMHMRGAPRTMQEAPRYKDVVGEVLAFLRERLDAFAAAGGDPARAWIDPGIGFGKTLEHNLEILRRLEDFKSLGRPLVIGASRKSFLGPLTAKPGTAPNPPEERLEGSLAVACRAAEAGVDVVRVHDVAATRRALETFAAARGR